MVPYLVIWSPNANLTYYQILEYLEAKWTTKEVIAFVNRTEEAINHICDNPLLFPSSFKNNVHRCVIVKQVSLFYQINDDTIQLLFFWDNRRNPNNLKL